MTAPLLVEIGCEEIPARMIPGAAETLGARVAAILDRFGFVHGAVRAWGGSRRLTVRAEDVEATQDDRVERIVGPPADVGLDATGRPTRAALGFARKQGVGPSELTVFETERGLYLGVERKVEGRGVGDVLAEELPSAVEGMGFPKTMRWGEGRFRWVRPVHWILALYGARPLPVELFGVRADGFSRGHRFLAPGPVAVTHADEYVASLEAAHVIADPRERRRRLAEALERSAAERGGELVDDPDLLEEVADLVEWPGVVTGSFDEAYLRLPREILVATLRHHQKCFSVHSGSRLQPVFLAVANTDRDPGGHVQRGNEWVVSGRLADARFFWEEDRARSLESRLSDLEGVGFHEKLGSYADKAKRTEGLARALAERLGTDRELTEAAARAALLAKADLVTDLVGEFPELQGIVGGLLLRDEGEPASVASGVYEHYKPQGPEDGVPSSEVGAIVSVADKLDTVAGLLGAGERATGSRDPFALRRAVNGIFRIVEQRRWSLSLQDMVELGRGADELAGFVRERYAHFLRERGYTLNEILAVLRPRVSDTDSLAWPLHDVAARLEAIRPLRDRKDFEHLVDLTKRVDNILTKESEARRRASSGAADPSGYRETAEAALALSDLISLSGPRMQRSAEDKDYAGAVETIASFIEPVERFFQDVLVIDPDHPEATYHRCEVLARLRALLTSFFDIRELAGQAERS